jgi:hypothetical protein
MMNRNRASAVALDQNTEKFRKSDAWNLPAWSRVLLVKSVFPAVERAAATDATHRRVNRPWLQPSPARTLPRNEGSGTDLQ